MPVSAYILSTPSKFNKNAVISGTAGGNPATDQGVAQGVIDHVQQLMDKHDGQCHFKGEAKQILQVCSGCGASHEDDAGLNHFRDFPFIMDEGDSKVEFPDLDAGLLLTMFAPRGRKHEIHYGPS